MANKKSTSSKKSSTNKTVKTVVKASKKMAKSNPKAFIILVVVILVLGALGVGGYFAYKHFFAKSNETPDSSQRTSRSTYEGASGAIDINFLELGNKYTGDCTFIKAGDVDILIDAGSRQNSASTISNFVDSYCTDGILEYVIATHAHQDHIAGFVGSNKDEGVLKHYRIDTLIDFALTNATSSIYNNYVSLRDEKIASGDIAHHYTANECIQSNNKVFTLSEGITMEILDQKFYRETSSDENNYSVCALFTQGNNNYLFTGDLEKEGEKSLVELNDLPEVELFKGGHHGSYTANTDNLLSVIKPKNVCICCCAGSDEYTSNPDNMFPAQDAVNRIAKYTDKVYVTTVVSDDEKGYKSMNGNINFHCNDGHEYTITGSNNSLILKDTEWFTNNRTMPNEWKQQQALKTCYFLFLGVYTIGDEQTKESIKPISTRYHVFRRHYLYWRSFINVPIFQKGK